MGGGSELDSTALRPEVMAGGNDFPVAYRMLGIYRATDDLGLPRTAHDLI
jgi:hypothetical protein